MPYRSHKPEKKRPNKYRKIRPMNIYFLSSLRRLAMGMLSLGAELQVPALGRPEEGTGIGNTYGMRSGAETALMFIGFMGL
jgi:hypothetical protein